MYTEFLNKEVCVYVTAKSQELYEYHGTLEIEDKDIIKLKNVTINCAQAKIGNSLFGSDITKYKSNVETAIINKEYIVSIIIE